jgi:hypothetical protein
MQKMLIILSSLSILAYTSSCATTPKLPDPIVKCPSPPAELMIPPSRPQPIEG